MRFRNAIGALGTQMSLSVLFNLMNISLHDDNARAETGLAK